jgi:hypothetical protein
LRSFSGRDAGGVKGLRGGLAGCALVFFGVGFVAGLVGFLAMVWGSERWLQPDKTYPDLEHTTSAASLLVGVAVGWQTSKLGLS